MEKASHERERTGWPHVGQPDRVHGTTHAEQGTRAFGLLASVIETCRKRKILPWPYLAQVIAERRKGNPAPSFASAALVA